MSDLPGQALQFIEKYWWQVAAGIVGLAVVKKITERGNSI